jgi:tRNA(adenine34) deaminase
MRMKGEQIEYDETWMKEALRAATEKGRDPSLNPIGCVIIKNGRLLTSAQNRVAEDHDATAHAEMVAIRSAGAAFEQGELRGATLYTTLQPCGMCTMASIWSKVGRIVYGAGRDDVHRMYFEARHVDTLEFATKAYRDDLVITGGILRDECAKLYYGPDDDPPREQQGNL